MRNNVASASRACVDVQPVGQSIDEADRGKTVERPAELVAIAGGPFDQRRQIGTRPLAVAIACSEAHVAAGEQAQDRPPLAEPDLGRGAAHPAGANDGLARGQFDRDFASFHAARETGECGSNEPGSKGGRSSNSIHRGLASYRPSSKGSSSPAQYGRARMPVSWDPATQAGGKQPGREAGAAAVRAGGEQRLRLQLG